MNILDRIKNLPDDDKKHLTLYCIYNEIYNSAQNNNFEITDEDAMTIQEKSKSSGQLKIGVIALFCLRKNSMNFASPA